MNDTPATTDICGRRSRGNRRSVEAHASGKERRPTQTQRIIAYLEHCGGATCEEIAEALGMRYTTVSARLSELKECRRIAHQPSWFATEPAGLFLLNDGTDRLWVTEAYLDERRN